MLEKILAILLIIIVFAPFGVLIPYWMVSADREEAIKAGFSKDEVDEDLGTGHGVIHYIRHG